LFAICEAQEKIVPGSARFAATALGFSLGGGGRERRLSLVEGQPLGQDGVVTAFNLCMQARPERVESNAALAGEVCGVTGAAQQLLHLARPVFLLDLDQGLEFTQVMGVAQGMKHARHRVVGLPVVMQAHDILPKNSRLKL
jgi:hypothetical protein